MNSLHKIGVVAVTGILLSGCSLFRGHESAALNANIHAQQATAEAIAEIELEVGRKNLAEGNLATAARYLASARTNPLTRADATNALGVVYVRLGRLDVAQRYFREALEVEPDNARFATNLARVEGDVSFARARALDADIQSATAEVAQLELPALPTPQQVDAPAPAPVTATSARRQGHVIHIRTTDGPAHAPPRMEVYARRPVVQMVERDETQGEVPQQQEREVSRIKVVDYPVRIEI
ncbi:tetratricopeptide repeat protein [Aurantiacibacter odishensis]|uniref:tetratricopeptide repeat protein n=1 Tax=Aurantiacibacter odishensis TaxID=1155476 RepID=UPI000E761260|nr:tetratricopeptide repeat protein [Aurantiacibacter odishensis]